MNQKFDNYLTTHFADLGDDHRTLHRLESIRANYGNLLRERAARRILEIGPGLGEMLHFLTRECGATNVEAIDLSPEVAAYCSERYCPTVHTPDPLQFLAGMQGRYDVIILLHVLEHVEKPNAVAFVRALSAALAPGGCVIVEVPNMGNPLVGLSYRYADFTHEIGFTESSLAQLLRLGGFKQVEILPFKIPRTSLARFVQFALRQVLEGFMRLLARLYSARVELNSANLVAIAKLTS